MSTATIENTINQTFSILFFNILTTCITLKRGKMTGILLCFSFNYLLVEWSIFQGCLLSLFVVGCRCVDWDGLQMCGVRAVYNCWHVRYGHWSSQFIQRAATFGFTLRWCVKMFRWLMYLVERKNGQSVVLWKSQKKKKSSNIDIIPIV